MIPVRITINIINGDYLKIWANNQYNIIILQPDKDNGLVLLDRPDYVNKMVTILSDETKFEKITDIDQLVIIAKLESKLNKTLIEFQHENILSILNMKN